MLMLLLTLLTAVISYAEKPSISSKGELRIETRMFTNDDNSATQDFGYGLAGRLEVEEVYKNFKNRLQVFSRVDRMDSSRQRFNVEEAYTQYIEDSYTIFAGYRVLNWSTAEAFHPTDVINARNFDSSLENAEKLGELMVGVDYLGEYINVSAFFMPTLAVPQLPESQNRLSFTPPGLVTNELQFINNDGEFMENNDFVAQWALRTQIMLDNWEFNFFWVHHFDRTDIRPVVNPGNFEVTPVLSQVDHYAFSFQYVWDAFIFKSENAFRDFQETTNVATIPLTTLQRDDYFISSLAVEYLDSHESGSDTTYILEYQHIFGVDDDNQRYLINPFQRDILFGVRHAFNDENGKEIFVSVIADVERAREIIASASYAQRLSDVWKINTSVRYIDAAPTATDSFTGLRALNNDHQFNLSLSRFF